MKCCTFVVNADIGSRIYIEIKICRDERSEKNEPTKDFSASDMGNLDNVSVDRMR